MNPPSEVPQDSVALEPDPPPEKNRDTGDIAKPKGNGDVIKSEASLRSDNTGDLHTGGDEVDD